MKVLPMLAQPTALLMFVLYWTCRSRIPWFVEYQSKEKLMFDWPTVLASISTPWLYWGAPAACVAQPLLGRPRTRQVNSENADTAVPAVARMSPDAVSTAVPWEGSGS